MKYALVLALFASAAMAQEAPSNVKVERTVVGNIKVSWTHPGGTHRGFAIFLNAANKTKPLLKDNVRSYIFTNPPKEEVCAYKIVATYKAGNKASPLVCAPAMVEPEPEPEPEPTVEVAPTNVKALRDGSSVKLTWEHPGGITYRVWYASTIVSPILASDLREYTAINVSSSWTSCAWTVRALYPTRLISDKVCATVGTTPPPPPESFTTNITFTPPTQRTDNSTLQAGDIISYRISYHTATGTKQGEFVYPASTQQPIDILLPAGTWKVRVVARDSNGLESVQSADTAASTVTGP